MGEIVEAEVSFGEAKITVRGPQAFVQSEVTRLALLSRGGGALSRLEPSLHNHSDEGGLGGATNEREFFVQKAPKGHHEAVTVLGFWLKAQGASDFSDTDVRRAYVRAGVRPPKSVSQALRDAKRRLDSIEQGSKRGLYRLTSHGDRLVRFDLPRA